MRAAATTVGSALRSGLRRVVDLLASCSTANGLEIDLYSYDRLSLEAAIASTDWDDEFARLIKSDGETSS